MTASVVHPHEVLRAWFLQHCSNPVPSTEDLTNLQRTMGLTEDVISSAIEELRDKYIVCPNLLANQLSVFRGTTVTETHARMLIRLWFGESLETIVKNYERKQQAELQKEEPAAEAPMETDQIVESENVSATPAVSTDNVHTVSFTNLTPTPFTVLSIYHQPRVCSKCPSLPRFTSFSICVASEASRKHSRTATSKDAEDTEVFDEDEEPGEFSIVKWFAQHYTYPFGVSETGEDILPLEGRQRVCALKSLSSFRARYRKQPHLLLRHLSKHQPSLNVTLQNVEAAIAAWPLGTRVGDNKKKVRRKTH